MQMVDTVVDRQLILPAVEAELSFAYPVAVAAHDRALERFIVDISVQVIEPQDNIIHPAVPVGSFQRYHDGAVIDNLRRHPAGI